MKGNCRKGHSLDTPGNAYVGTRTDGSTYRYCKLCATARSREKAAAIKSEKEAKEAGVFVTDALSADGPSSIPEAGDPEGPSPIPEAGSPEGPSTIPEEGDLA